ncbi:MAG TPA: phosphoribosylaminoimidazolesuccinocarboxamide synthase, partial [Myxococcaceae bacterium]|nr:phosphoribosylaminoimidazolesuccinocarboxamide synthase [Myxococcaceae bacterium]
LSAFWFERTRDVAPNHLLDVLDPGVMVARACQPFAVEFVVRGYLTGSLWRDYEKGQRSAYGRALADGMRRDERFDAPWVTPSTKAPLGEHDAPITPEEVVGRGLMTQREWGRAREMALAVFNEGQRWAHSRGLILVDTKYEFGKVGGELLLIDEVHTPDSSRYWVAEGSRERFERGESQRMLDKENIRQWLIAERGFQGHGTAPEIPDDVRVDLADKYLAAFQQITGAPLPLRVGDARERTLASLRAKGLIPDSSRA